MATLIFVDTVIYLDYYRFQGDASLSILDQFVNYKDRIITTTQVEMEYKKNRRNVIIESTKSIYQPPSSIVIPSFLRESHAKSIKSSQQQLSKQTKELKEKTAILLREPGRNDPVYKSLQKFFASKAPCHFHINLDDNMKSEIEAKAHRRFLLGYPPRKGKDTSIGDSINWEWIIHCAKIFSANIIIVSRDSDYGFEHDNDSILNDWLQQEFKERVNKNCQLTLTPKLTEAFKLASIPVTKEQELSEKQLFVTIGTKNLPPEYAGLNPPFASTDVSVSPNFVWNSIVGANSYEFVLQLDNGIIKYSAVTTINSHICKEILEFNTTYYWRVRANIGDLKSPWIISFFTTGFPP